MLLLSIKVLVAAVSVVVVAMFGVMIASVTVAAVRGYVGCVGQAA